VQDVAGFLVRKGIALRDYLDDQRPARIDPEHMVRIGYEAYFFADGESRARFLDDPVRYCGRVTDPVSRRRFRPRSDAPAADHGGVLYLFESRRNQELFGLQPERYSRPRWAM